MHKIGSQNSLLDYYLHFILGSLNNNKTAILTLWLTLLYFFENATPSPGFTLILLHSTGFHKEIWEPTLEEICSLLQEESKGIISQAWSIECPNHGASSTLNEAALSLPENKLNCGSYIFL